MPYPSDSNRPQVFLSFAGDDRPAAKRLSSDLLDRGIDAFVDDTGIEPGQDFILAINRAIAQSDYYLLLWSRHTVDRRWVDIEWSAAFSTELSVRRRSFLFLVRLDDTPLPPLLAPRKYLDAFGDWDGVVDQLATIWTRDREVGTPVLPAPKPVATPTKSIVLYVRNLALSVSHVVAVPAEVTSQELRAAVKEALELPDSESKFSGVVGMRFEYELRQGGAPIPDQPQLTDYSTIDLVVQVELLSRSETVSTWTLRTQPDGQGRQSVIKPATIRTLIDSAFGHLMPR